MGWQFTLVTTSAFYSCLQRLFFVSTRGASTSSTCHLSHRNSHKRHVLGAKSSWSQPSTIDGRCGEGLDAANCERWNVAGQHIAPWWHPLHPGSEFHISPSPFSWYFKEGFIELSAIIVMMILVPNQHWTITIMNSKTYKGPDQLRQV